LSVNGEIMRKLATVLFFVGLIPSAVMAGTDVSTKISSGFFYSSGQSQTLGSASSKMYSVPFMASLGYKRLHASLSTSYLRVDNQYPLSVQRVSQKGMGDTLFSLGYDLTESPWLTVKVKHKFATGDKAKGLSTGKDDTSLQLDYFTPVGTKTSAFATLGYKFVGKVAGSQMKNSGYVSAGMGYILTSKTSVGFSVDYQESSFQTLNNQLGESLFVSYSATKAWSISGFGAYDNTQTTSLGLTFTRKL